MNRIACRTPRSLSYPDRPTLAAFAIFAGAAESPRAIFASLVSAFSFTVFC